MGMLKADQWKPSTKMHMGEFTCWSLPRWRSGEADMFVVFFALYDLIETPNPDDPLVSSIVSIAVCPLQTSSFHQALTHRAG
jgi:ubiquitin-conjugating enzyme E2 D/E